MTSHMRREADFWNSQSNQFHMWPDIKQTYTSAMDAMPSFPSDELKDSDRTNTDLAHKKVSLYPCCVVLI